MFNGYNETPHNPSNENKLGKEKKTEYVAKWWCGSSNGNQQVQQQTHRAPEFWSPKTNFVRMQKCNCSDCYSSNDTPSYQNSTSRHRPWLPKTFSVPTNNSNELSKLPGYQWENCLFNKTSYDTSDIPNLSTKEFGGKYPYHRLSQPNQHVVVPAVRNPDLVKNPKDEISNDMGFYDLYRSQQQVICNPAWNLSKTFNNSDLYNLNEKYQNANTFKHSIIPHSAEQHANRAPVVEPYTKVVPFFQNRVPSTGHQSFKNEFIHCPSEINFNNAQKTQQESNEFLDNKNLKLSNNQMGKEVNNINPSNDSGPNLKSNGMVPHYAYNLPYRTSYDSGNQKFSFENLQEDNSFVRKNVIKSSGDLETDKQWQINQISQHFSDGSLNKFKNSYGVLNSEACKDNKISKPTLNDIGGPLCAQLHEGIVRNDSYWLQKPGYNDSRAANYFHCQNDPSTCRNYSCSDYPPLSCNAPGRHEQYISVSQEKLQCQFAQKNYQSTQNYDNNQITYHSIHTPAPNHFFQQRESKSTQQQYLPYKENPIPISEQSFVSKTDCLEAIRNEDANQNRKNKISPLRLLRKKKNLNQNYLELPTKNLSGEQTLDVRKFFSTWAEEEEENETPTQVLVLDCQNIDPEQTKVLYLYENNGIVTLKSADSLKDPDKDEGNQESKEELLLNIGQGIVESMETEDVKKQYDAFVRPNGLEPQSLPNDERHIKPSSESKPSLCETKTKLVNQENCFDLIKKPELYSQNKVVPSNIANENENLNKWAEKLHFLKVSEVNKTEISQNKEEQEKRVERQNFLLELSENEMLASNFNPESQVLEDNNKGSLTLEANVQTEINDSPALPTSEFRRNKFLNYTKQNIDVSLKKSNEIEAKEKKVISEKIKLDEIICQEKGLTENNLAINFAPSDKTNSKLILKSGEKVVDDITSKLSEINFEKPEVKIENESLQKKIEASHNKKIKKRKRVACETENDEKNDKVTVDKIKFSIQKSHDLKISFKVLNSAAPKSEDKIDKTEESMFQQNSNEESREMITLKLKSIQNTDFSENNRRLKKKKLKKDNQKIPVVKVKNSTSREEKKPAFEDEKFGHRENVTEDSSFQTHSNDFHVKETVDSAKIKLTFKRHKSKSEAKCLGNGRLGGLENKSKMKRREKGVDSTQGDLNCTQKSVAEIKIEPEKDNDVLSKEESIEFPLSNSSVKSPKLSSSSNVPFPTNEIKNLTNRVSNGKEVLVNQLEDTQVEFFENVKLETLDPEKEDNIQIDESAAESVINNSPSEILSNKNFIEENKDEIKDTSFDCNIDMNSKDMGKPYEFFLIEESHLKKKEKEGDTLESEKSSETQNNPIQKNDVDISKTSDFLKETVEGEENYEKLIIITAGKIKKENDNNSLEENSGLNRVTSEEKNSKNSEIIIEELQKTLENQFLSVNEVAENESFSCEKVEEFSKVDDIGMRNDLSEVFNSSCDLNSISSESPTPRKKVVSEALNSNLSIDDFNVEPLPKKHEAKGGKVIEVINSISNKIQCFGPAKKVCYDENGETSSLKSLQNLESSEEKNNKSKSCANFRGQAEKLSNCSFAVIETVEESNFLNNNETPIEDSFDYSQDNQSVKSICNESVSFSPPSSKISDINMLKSNGEGQSTEAIQTIYKVSTNCNTLPHDKERGEELKERKLAKSPKVMHTSLTKTTDLKNFSLKPAEKELSKQQDSVQKIQIKSKFTGWLKEPVFKSYKIKRRHSFVQTLYGCNSASSLNSSTKRFFRYKSCPPRAVFSITSSTPHLDIPIQDIPLPAGDPLPENIFDFKRYFSHKNKMSTLDTKNCSETINSSLKTEEKSNFQKIFKKWKKEKGKRSNFENHNLSKFKEDVKLPLKQKSKIKFSLPKLKSLKTFFTEKEDENLVSVNREPKKCDSSNLKSEHPNKVVVIEPVLNNENDSLIGVFETGENRELEHINTNVKKKCQKKLIVDSEKSEFISPSALDNCSEDLSSKIQCDWKLQIVQEAEEESVILTELNTDSYIENEFYKCEDIPTSEDLTNGEEVTEDQKVSDDDKFRNIMQNCLENAKKFLNEGSVKLPSCPDSNTTDLELGKPNINKNEVPEGEDNITSQNIQSVANGTCLSEIFQQEDRLSSFENSQNLYSEELPVDNWPYLEEEVQSSSPNNSPKDIISLLTNEDDCSQYRFQQSGSIEKNKSISKSKHLKRSRCKSLPAEMNSVLSNAQQIKQRRTTLDVLDKQFWSCQKISNKMVQQISYQLEKYRQKSISPKIYSSIKSATKMHKSYGKSKTIKAFNYKSSKWQPKVILHRISEIKEEKNVKIDESDSLNVNEIVELKQIEQKPRASVQMFSDLSKNEGENSSQYLKVSPDTKFRNKDRKDNSRPNFDRDSEIKKRKKSRFRNLYSKEKKEIKLPHGHKTSVAEPDKHLIEAPSKTKLSWEIYNQEKRKNAEDKSCFKKKDKKQKTLDFRYDKNGLEKEIGEKVFKQKMDNLTNHHHHHHSKKSKHKHYGDHKEKKDTSRPDSRRRSHSSENVEKPKKPETQDSGDELLFKEPWVCQVCGFSDLSQRVSHIKSHPFHCQSCHLAFKAESFFINHLTKKHKDIRNQHHCLLCELSFDTEGLYLQHLETREHRHLESVEKNTINTLFTLLTGQPCPVLGVVEMKPDWLPNQAGTVHFYHQATPLSLALQYLKMRRDISSYSSVPSSHFK